MRRIEAEISYFDCDNHLKKEIGKNASPLEYLATSDGPNSYFQYLRIRISMRIFYFNICECEYYTLIFSNANANIFFHFNVYYFMNKLY